MLFFHQDFCPDTLLSGHKNAGEPHFSLMPKFTEVGRPLIEATVVGGSEGEQDSSGSGITSEISILERVQLTTAEPRCLCTRYVIPDRHDLQVTWQIIVV